RDRPRPRPCRRPHPGPAADLTPADVAVQVWLDAPDRLERAHAEQHLPSPRTFEYYHTDPAAPPGLDFGRPSDLEAELNAWFERNRRGRTARVFPFNRDDGLWYLVRHGEPFKREEAAAATAGAEPASIAYRPLRYDVVVFDPGLGELRVNAPLKGAKELYRTAFGRHLYGFPGAFPRADLYTLDPLRTDGPAALACADVPELERVTLREVQLYVPGSPWELVTHKSDDVFGLFAARDAGFPAGGRLSRAAFDVKFAAARRPRSVVVRPPNVAQFARDADAAAVERWLAARGFLRGRGDGRG
ncbi:hypothetical protein J0H58_18770, partial [bacterium]|nr:hypothetical protein [bacterium]